MNEPTTPAATRWPWWQCLLWGLLAVVPTGYLIWEWGSLGEQRIGALAHWLYWWMPLTCAFAAVCFAWGWLARESRLLDCLRNWWPGLVLAVAATLVVFWVSPPQMRVQFDETSIVGVSQNMSLQRMAVMTTGAVPSQGQVVPMENMVDKRPTLFAFVVSCVHELRGYRIENAFLVNGLLLALGLFVLFAATRSRLGLYAGLSAPLLVLSVPLTCVVATSAGFELFATVLLLVATVAALELVDRPSDGWCATFVGACMLLAHSRYESILAVALLGGLVVLLLWRRYRPGRRVWWLLALCPGLLTPLFFLLQHAQNPNFTPEAGGQSLVSFAHLVAHVGPFLTGWFGGGIGSALPGWLAIVAALLWLRRVLQREATRVDLFAMVPLALTTVVLAWFYGDVREQTALRLFLPLAWLSLLPLLLSPLSRLIQSRRAGIALLLASLAICALRLPFVADGTAFPQLPIASLTSELDRMVKRLPGDRATTLWVGMPAQHLIVKGHAAVSVSSFERMGQNIAQLQRQGDVAIIYLIETPLDRDMEPVFGSPRKLLRRVSSRVVERAGGVMPITVHQIGR
tara:strand:+ start:31050 stop:32765 length:1716 start_codon:yes stop_codon:yes gene_type:complete